MILYTFIFRLSDIEDISVNNLDHEFSKYRRKTCWNWSLDLISYSCSCFDVLSITQDIEFCDYEYELISQQVCLIFNSISQTPCQGYGILYLEKAMCWSWCNDSQDKKVIWCIAYAHDIRWQHFAWQLVHSNGVVFPILFVLEKKWTQFYWFFSTSIGALS